MVMTILTLSYPVCLMNHQARSRWPPSHPFCIWSLLHDRRCCGDKCSLTIPPECKLILSAATPVMIEWIMTYHSNDGKHRQSTGPDITILMIDGRGNRYLAQWVNHSNIARTPFILNRSDSQKACLGNWSDAR